MEYNFRDIEKKWQEHWKDTHAYQVPNTSNKPKYYVLDMFPYPSGAGLHVGHPLGYIASDIFARYKRLKGYNVLHPMGYDAFGLPAEQYAIDHGVHPAVSTHANIINFRKQLDNIGFCYDWDREVRTSEPNYYKWTQWIFLQLFHSWYNRAAQKAEPIATLITLFEQHGSAAPGARVSSFDFTAEQWQQFAEKERMDVLMEYRLAYCGYGEVNWCEALGTVLANDEVVNGVSERGGFPVVKKKLRQWYLRITEYADRLLEGLDRIDFSDAMKEMQTNWIGKSSGAEIDFRILIPNPSPEGEGGKVAHGANFQKAREMRKAPTEAEAILWEALRNRKLGYKFRRQHPFGHYILDFASLEVKLNIEVDGGYHLASEQIALDKERDAYLNEVGFTTLRFANEEVLQSLPAVLSKIKEAADALQINTDTNDQSPSPRGEGLGMRVYTTRPDTIFGVDFMVIAPEHELVEQISSTEQQQVVDDYIAYVKSRSERERMAEKKITGVFTGAYAINPFDGRQIPIWISEYVLAGYGTGAIMAVPCGDERDFKFAQHFSIPVTNIIGEHFNGEEANATKDAILQNSGFLNGKPMREAMELVINKIEELGIGTRRTNYRMRDAAFSRQRYWGEPFPIKWVDGTAYPLSEAELPLELPEVESYKPGPEGEGPLANIESWTAKQLETNTMPGYAGSSWYFLRYMDPHNDTAFCDRKVSDYWGQVDLYIGGTEHAVGHLLYSRMWTKALYDLGHIGFDEPYKKLVNQGMIQGSSRFVYKLKHKAHSGMDKSTSWHVIPIVDAKNNLGFITTIDKFGIESAEIYFSADYVERILACNDWNDNHEFIKIHVDVNYVDGLDLDVIALYNAYQMKFENSIFITESQGFRLYNGATTIHHIGLGLNSTFVTTSEVEKMSKSKFNTVNPDDLVFKYGADTFRMYEMFLGPVEMSKPWDTKGIEGVHRFLKKLWRLFYKETASAQGAGEAIWTGEKATAAELKVLHHTIRKIENDTERFSFNTGVSAFMIAVNELSDLKCHKREILEPLLVLLTPYAPHICAELWSQLGNTSSVLDAAYPAFEEKYVTETTKEYPVSVNGKLRTTINIALDAAQPDVEAIVLQNEVVQKWLEGKSPKKIIFVKGKMVNIVI